MLIFLSVFGGVANALTLEETVARAAEVSPSAVIAELEWRQARLDAAEKWSGMTITPEITVERSWVASTVVEDGAMIKGPAIIEEPFTTIVLHPGQVATLDRLGNYRIEL